MLSVEEINRLQKENEELHKYVEELKEQVSKSVSDNLTLVAIKDFFQRVLNGEV